MIDSIVLLKFIHFVGDIKCWQLLDSKAFHRGVEGFAIHTVDAVVVPVFVIAGIVTGENAKFLKLSFGGFNRNVRCYRICGR